VGSLTSHNPIGLHGLLQGQLYFTKITEEAAAINIDGGKAVILFGTLSFEAHGNREKRRSVPSFLSIVPVGSKRAPSHPHLPPSIGAVDQKPTYSSRQVLYLAMWTGTRLKGTKYLDVTLDRKLPFKACTKLVHGKVLRAHVTLYSFFRNAQLCAKADIHLARFVLPCAYRVWLDIASSCIPKRRTAVTGGAYSNCWSVIFRTNSVVLVRKRTKPTERPLLVDEVSANFCG
jgi:hypothetical protein